MTPYIDSTSHLLRSTYLRLHRLANREFLAHGVTADQYVLLRILSETNGISQQELGRISASDPTTIGRMLELLEQRQYVKRKVHPADRRTRLVTITRTGRTTVKKLVKAGKLVCAPLESTLSQEAQCEFQQALKQLAEAFEYLEQSSILPPASDAKSSSGQ